MKAFAGESQARNRYNFAAKWSKNKGFHVVERVFNFTAEQEKEHAKIFYKYLKDLAGSTIKISGDYPIDIYDNPVDLLKCAKENEYEEYNNVYKSFKEEAKSEGFNDIAETFNSIAEIEKIHGERFEKFENLIKNNRLFVSDVEEGWICLNCGNVYTGKEVPEKCPVCSHDRGYFIRTSFLIV